MSRPTLLGGVVSRIQGGDGSMNSTLIPDIYTSWIIALLLIGTGAAFITWAVAIAKSSKKLQTPSR